jgi:hypothetical protein
MTTQEKEILKIFPEEECTMYRFGWAVNMRNEFGMREKNDELIRSCEEEHPDDAALRHDTHSGQTADKCAFLQENQH